MSDELVVRSSWRAVPDDLIFTAEGNVIKVYAALAWFARSGRGAWPSQQTVATKLDMSERSVRRHIAWLQSHGWIATTRDDRRTTNVYWVNEYPFQEAQVATGEGADRTQVAGADRTQVAGAETPKPQVAPDQPTLSMTRSANDHLPPSGVKVAVVVESSRKERPPDPLWEAFLTVCNIDPASLSKDRRGRLNGMVSNLRKLGATPEEVYLRAMNWAWDVPMTDFAFVKHWADLAQPYRPKPDASDRMLVQARIDEAQAQRRREEGARDERDRGDARLPEAPHVLPGGPRDAAGHRGELRGAVPEVPHGARR